MSAITSVRIEPKIHAALEHLAARSGRSFSAELRLAFRQHIEFEALRIASPDPVVADALTSLARDAEHRGRELRALAEEGGA